MVFEEGGTFLFLASFSGSSALVSFNDRGQWHAAWLCFGTTFNHDVHKPPSIGGEIFVFD